MTTTPTDASVRPVVPTPHGPVRGIRREDPRGFTSDAFCGIPFAAPPQGALRFAAPQEPAPWTKPRDASAYGPTPQRVPFGEVTAIPEPTIPGTDTLSVNVFTPPLADAEREGARLPVLVWIHGGGYKAGSAASPWYDGAAFARDGIVTVTISYRLGLDGFGSVPGAPDNRGLRDQIAALTWVRRAIGAFGGDPERVTIAGQSAGGGSVLALLASPAAEGLFRAGISQSGALRRMPLETARERTARLAQIAGVEPTLEGLATLDDAAIDATQAALEGELGAAAQQAAAASAAPLADWVAENLAGADMPGLAFYPVADDEILPREILDALADPPARRPLLAGAVADEFSMAGRALAGMLGGADVAEALGATVVGDLAGRLVTELNRGHPAADALGGIITLGTFRLPLLEVADRSAGPVFVYDLRFAPRGGTASHCIDVPFVFDALGTAPEHVMALCGEQPPQELADAVHGAWVRFIADGEPGWPAWETADGRGMRLGGPEASGDCAVEPLLGLERALAARLAEAAPVAEPDPASSIAPAPDHSPEENR